MKPAQLFITRGMRGVLIFAGWLSIVACADAAHLILRDGSRIDGANVRLNAQGAYVIETAAGSRTYKKAQVARAEADKPEGWDQAMQAANGGQAAQAIDALNAIARRTRGLGWDLRANSVIARLQVAEGDYADAVKTLESMPAEALASPELQGAYWKALLESGEFEKLEGKLNKSIQGGERAEAAQAQILRGDIKMKRRQLEPAALDYLRTVALFKAQKGVQPEALYKAGLALEELRHAKANDLFEQLIQEYPNSEYAEMAQNR